MGRTGLKDPLGIVGRVGTVPTVGVVTVAWAKRGEEAAIKPAVRERILGSAFMVIQGSGMACG